nr:hypothetical protein [Tanacetum cinerariifolium]
SLEQGQEQATITFGALWQPVLALEAWTRQTDALKGALWQARYEDQREIHALRMQHAADQREIQELRDRISPTLSPGILARVKEEMTLSPSSFRKRYRGTSEPILDTETEGDESDDEGPDSESEDSKDEDEHVGLGYGVARCRALELTEGITHSTYEVGQSSRSVLVQQIVDETTTPRLPVCTTWEDPMDDTVYTDIECNMPPVRAPVQTPASPDWSYSSLPISTASLTVPSLVATPTSVKPLCKGFLAELGAKIELHEGILHERLEALLPTLFEGYSRDFTELFARSVATGQTDALKGAQWQARYEDQREIHALRMQHAADQREIQELRDRIAVLEQRMDRLKK